MTKTAGGKKYLAYRGVRIVGQHTDCTALE
jgi:hypothetical protein